jgi:ATP-binding cassette subfamily B protein
LDEAFRGLQRDQRGELLRRTRGWWPHATVLFVTHDVADTLALDRVIVMEAGQVREHGIPTELAAVPSSRYAAMLRAEHALLEGIRGAPEWRRLRLDGGRLHESSSRAVRALRRSARQLEEV